MPTPVSLFDYDLPEELIAQRSVEPRDHSRLMVVYRQTRRWQHRHFSDMVDELKSGDVLVMNNTKVFRARLEATVNDKPIELFLLRPREGAWEALVKPGHHVRVGDTIRLGDLEGKVVSKSDVVTIDFVRSANEASEQLCPIGQNCSERVPPISAERSEVISDTIVFAYAQEHGQIPIPPYVHELPEKLEQYQTVYAQETGSVAAPTAGFHFTTELLEKIRAKGVEIRYVTLHVGLGTFRPIKSETIEEHKMHSEFVTIDSSTAIAINQAKQEGRRVIAVGTTTVRTLEGVAHVMKKTHPGEKKSTSLLPADGFSGDVNLFITPGFDFRVVDALITNFHLPKSTLLVLVSAFAGREHVLAAYHEAIRERYRFFSFGDAMFIQ